MHYLRRLKLTVLNTALLMVVLLLSSCQRPYAILLHNNSGENLTILIIDSEVEWQSGQTLRVTPSSRIADINVRDLDYEYDQGGWVIVVQTSKATRKYVLSHPRLPEEYLGNGLGGAWERYFQLEPDGGLYIVKADTPFPVESLPSQPPGLPIKPDNI